MPLSGFMMPMTYLAQVHGRKAILRTLITSISTGALTLTTSGKEYTPGQAAR